MLKSIIRSKFTYIVFFLFALVLAWWIYLQTNNKDSVYYYYGFYSVISLTAGLFGIYISQKKWGGFSSVIGRAVMFLSFGLLGQAFGLLTWTYYNILKEVAIPYPSIADIGYFALIPFYSYAALMIAKASGVKFALRSKKGKLWLLLIPIAMLAVAYGLFLKDTSFEDSSPLRIFLDIGYPLGDVIPVTIAVLTLILSSSLLGGMMRSRIMWLIFAFIFQFATDYTFLYLIATEKFTDGGIVDLMYPVSHLVMAVGIIGLSNISLKKDEAQP